MQIKWLSTALQNLDAEAEYIAKANPDAAKLVAQRIVDAVNLLEQNPAMGHAGRVPGTHEIVVPNTRYIIPYRVRPRLDRIEILRIFHTSRKPPKGW